ncbi:MAG TPA: hypothetical protein PKN67_06760, partial [Pseudomonadales bacterium]|nr:hypothetical protein [Pseudomonadales bacterium]
IAEMPAEALVALDDGGVGALQANRLLRTGPDLKPRIPRDEHSSAFAPPPDAKPCNWASPAMPATWRMGRSKW